MTNAETILMRSVAHCKSGFHQNTRHSTSFCALITFLLHLCLALYLHIMCVWVDVCSASQMRLWHLPCQCTPAGCNPVSYVSACWLTGLGLGTPSRYSLLLLLSHGHVTAAGRQSRLIQKTKHIVLAARLGQWLLACYVLPTTKPPMIWPCGCISTMTRDSLQPQRHSFPLPFCQISQAPNGTEVSPTMQPMTT